MHVLLLTLLFVCGAFVGALANLAIYRWAWSPREISPWSTPPQQAPPRQLGDRIPIAGWFGLRREEPLHGRGFWLRPMLIELAAGVGWATLYWWEVDAQALVRPQIEALFNPPPIFQVPGGALVGQWFCHALLMVLMIIASFIDIDEKIIPDQVTVTGTLLGLVLSTLVVVPLLPNVALEAVPPPGRVVVHNAAGPIKAFDAAGNPVGTLTVQPTTAASPQSWPRLLRGRPEFTSLAIGIACYWLWCFALLPRIWRGRRGLVRGLVVLTMRIGRELKRPPMVILVVVGTALIALIWWRHDTAWIGLLSALIGMVASGGIVWTVRIIGSLALRREAMGFGDVTLMMMIGTFVGWQAGLVLFFLAPFAALILGLFQLLTRRGDVLPYGPFLCLATTAVIVFWGHVWNRVVHAFAVPLLVPLVLVVCCGLLGVMLLVWQAIKVRLF